jgi:NADH-quinone oxidoreductase subunit L
MTVPLMVLAVFAVAIGGLLGPLMPAAFQFSHFLGMTPGLPHAHEEATKWGLMAISAIIALGGVGVAWLMYVRQPELPGKLAAAAQGFYQLSLNKFYIDELYDSFIVKPLRGLSILCAGFDQYIVDGVVDLVGHVPRLLGVRFRPVQNGLVQFYALAMVLGLTVFLLVLVSRL